MQCHPGSRQKPGKKNFNDNPPPCCGLLFIWRHAFTLFLACPPSALFCRHFVVHQLDTSSDYGLTVPPANSNRVPSRLGLLPERMFVFVSFYIFPLVTWHSSVGTRYLLYCWYERSRALFLVQYHVVVARYVVDVVYV